jgi:hypothetical protein
VKDTLFRGFIIWTIVVDKLQLDVKDTIIGLLIY